MRAYGLGCPRQRSAGFLVRGMVSCKHGVRVDDAVRGSMPMTTFIVSMIEERKDITLNELVARLAQERGLQMVWSAVNT